MLHVEQLLENYESHHNGAAAQIVKAAIDASNTPDFIRVVAYKLMIAAELDTRREDAIFAALKRGLVITPKPGVDYRAMAEDES